MVDRDAITNAALDVADIYRTAHAEGVEWTIYSAMDAIDADDDLSDDLSEALIQLMRRVRRQYRTLYPT